MKILRNILTIVIVGLTFTIYGQEISNDTVFIQKDSLLGTAQSIFIDNNRNSNFYDRINDWEFGLYDAESYKLSTDYLKENNLVLTKRTPTIPWTKWVQLKQHKGEFYVYHPCDFLFHFKASINDTTYIDWTGEGPVANKIIKQKKINDNAYKLILTGTYNKHRVLKIHIIERNLGIAVFEEKSKGSDKRRYLMIVSDKVKCVPIIVNNCETWKQNEMRFDSDSPVIEMPIIEPEYVN